MKDIYLIKYAVKGFKVLEDWVELSFYKKTFSKPFDIQNYNVKSIYGANGSGKSAIVTSLRVLKGIITDENYLNNPFTQNQLNALINKKLQQMEFVVEYISLIGEKYILYRYVLTLGKKNNTKKYQIIKESLSTKKAMSHSTDYSTFFEVIDGNIKQLKCNEEINSQIRSKTQNLLSNSSLTAAFFYRLQLSLDDSEWLVVNPFVLHFLFGCSLFVYLDNEDEHADYLFNMMSEDNIDNMEDILTSFKHKKMMNEFLLYMLSPRTMLIKKEKYQMFEKQIVQLKEFLSIFKRDLQNIEIDRKEYKDEYACNLILKYPEYSIDAEFESTGIKKLIKLFPYIQKMVNGEIVFIDEMDSNLHDVYLCALLEHLMEYGDGQLCFTTHNIGPMDILKHSKKSIDFLSIENKVYSWAASGNYSPSKLYKNGMIEGSPFNVDSIDFIGVFDTDEEL